MNALPFPTIDEFLKSCPLPPALSHMEEAIRSPIGESLLHSIMGAYVQGIRGADLEAVMKTVIEFYQQDIHRCSTCLCWTKDFAAGAVVDDAFHLIVVCTRCQKLIARGKATPTMARNMEAYAGGAK